MPKFAANLTTMYVEHDFMDRFAAAKNDGFNAVEFLFPYAVPASEIKVQLLDAQLAQVLFNCPPGNWNAGERGIAALPGREEEFKRGMEQALQYADTLQTKRLHVMAGVIGEEFDRAACRATYIQNLAYAARQAAMHDVSILIEPINTRDMPGYFLNRQDQAHAIVEEVGHNNLQVQFDIYHCQIVEGDVATKLRRHIAGIGHIQIAGVPDRQEPDTGELHYPYLFQLLDDLNYAGFIGCEYRPKNGTSEGLGWLSQWINKKH